MLKGSPLNGIDYLEVLDHATPPLPLADRQRTLYVHFINNLSGTPLTRDNVQIEGGERIRPVLVTNVSAGVGSEGKILTVEVDQPGDYSTYTLRIVKDKLHREAPDGFDPILSAIEFSFKVECFSEFDCKHKRVCPPEPREEPEIDYLEKDYASFRRLMLDRMTALMPKWKERNPADIGVGLVELLAYVGDYLSYQQDAVGTEAYLGTARRRVSVRRHARLVDYFMHEGCNARAWVHLQVNSDTGPLPKGTRILTRIVGQPTHLSEFPTALPQDCVVFETMHSVDKLCAEHNRLFFYTWQDERCCLPRGATSATLEEEHAHLREGNVLIFEEVLGPVTGQPEDADPSRRQAVRLTKVVRLADPLTDPPTPITEIEWAAEDALRFPFCISSTTDAEHGRRYVEKISVALGNIVLADHGLTVSNEPIPDTVPQPTLFKPPTIGEDRCREREPVPIPPRYRPQLKDMPLTRAAPLDPTGSASAAMCWNLRDAVPEIATLNSVLNGDTTPWHARKDLLSSAANDTHYVVETESDGTAYIRFGDGRRGARPEPGSKFTATYRFGNGVAGNVGAETLVHLVTNLTGITGVRNPLPAQGGAEPETIEDVRQRAPSAFRNQERAVTPEDYADVTEREPEVQRAAATFRWTGSWHTVFVTVDRLRGLAVDDSFKAKTRQQIERYRMAGYDLQVDAPRFVSLEIEMTVCVKPAYFREDVKEALLDLFSNRTLADGRRGVFHPDNFTFGQTVYLSPLYAAAQAVPGVASVEITKFQRQGTPDAKPLECGKLELSRLEIARLDNDPNFPEHGVFHLTAGGGK